ncbi:unnamed protein product, partial [Polarella glacialis]
PCTCWRASVHLQTRSCMDSLQPWSCSTETAAFLRSCCRCCSPAAPCAPRFCRELLLLSPGLRAGGSRLRAAHFAGRLC